MHRTTRAAMAQSVLPLALLALMALFCTTAHAAETVTDAEGRTVTVTSSARILSLGPDITEIVYALGAGERIVAVDRSSRYPADTASKANVGYRRALSVEGLVALQPDLILAAQDIGPPEAIDLLKALTIPVVFVPEDNSRRGVQRKIRLIAQVLNRTARGTVLAAEVADDFARTAAQVAARDHQARRSVIFLHGLARLSAAGGDTAAGRIIDLAGAVNPLADVKGYKQLSEEALMSMAPDAILMLSDGRGRPTPDEVFSTPALRNTPAARRRALIVLEGPYMLGFGPRTARAVAQLTDALGDETPLERAPDGAL